MGCFDAGEQKVSETKLPEWVNNAAQQTWGGAQSLSSRPYTPYPYARIAPTSGDQMASYDILRSLAPQVTGSTGQGAGMVAGGATAPALSYNSPRLIDNIPGMGSAAGSIEDYMNTYVNSVLGDTLGRNADSFSKAFNEIGGGFTAAGGHNDDRRGVYEAELAKDFTRSNSEITNNVMAQAFQNAMGLRESDLNRQLNTFQTNLGSYEGGLDRMMRGGAALPGVTGGDVNNTLAYTDALAGAGKEQQGQEQQSYDLAYGDFLRQLGYPEALVNSLSQTLSSLPYGQSTYGATPSTASQVLSTAGSLAALFI